MPKLNTTVKSVRVDNEKIDELEKRLNGQTFNSWLNDVIDDYLNGSSGTFSSKNGRDLLEMLSCFKKSESEFIDDVLLTRVIYCHMGSAHGGETFISAFDRC